MCLSIFPEIPSTWPPWQCRVRRTERTRRKYLTAAGTPPLMQRIFPPWHSMVCLEVSCICWRWSWAATAGYGWAKAVRPGFGFCWMILLAVGRRNLLRRWFCLDSTTFLSTSSFRKSKDDGKILILSSHFPFLGGNKVILFLSITETAFFNARFQSGKVQQWQNIKIPQQAMDTKIQKNGLRCRITTTGTWLMDYTRHMISP